MLNTSIFPRKRICWLCILFLAFAGTQTWAQSSTINPAWWSNQGVLSGNSPNDYAGVNQGQLKNIATAAYQEFQVNLIGGVGDMTPPGTTNAVGGVGYRLTALINGWSSVSTSGSGSRVAVSGSNTNDYLAVNLGQLKAVATPFYDRLIQVGYTQQYPWTSSTNAANDYAIANIGQMKNLFSFDVLSLLHLTIEGGNNQGELPNTVLAQPLTVKVCDHNNNPLSNAQVQFAVASGGGVLVPVNNGITDANGIAEATFQLPATPGAISINATVGNAWTTLVVVFTVTAGDPSQPSTAPGNVAVSSNADGSNSVTWTDNSNNETGFLIQSSTDGTTWTTVGTVGSDVNAFTDTSSSLGGTYLYQVSSTNLGNTGSGGANTSKPAANKSIPAQNYAVVDISGNSTGGKDVDLVALGESNNVAFGYSADANSYHTNTWQNGMLGAEKVTDTYDPDDPLSTLAPMLLISTGKVFGAYLDDFYTEPDTGWYYGYYNVFSSDNGDLDYYTLSDSYYIAEQLAGYGLTNVSNDGNHVIGSLSMIAITGTGTEIGLISNGNFIEDDGYCTVFSTDYDNEFDDDTFPDINFQEINFQPLLVNNQGCACGEGGVFWNGGGYESLPGTPLDMNDSNQVICGDNNGGAWLWNSNGSRQNIHDLLPDDAKLLLGNIYPWLLSNPDNHGTVHIVFNADLLKSGSNSDYVLDVLTSGSNTVARMEVPAGVYCQAINSNGLLDAIGTTSYTSGNNTHALLLLPAKLVNKVDPYAGSSVIGTSSHNGQDTHIVLSSTTGSTDINAVAWIAASDPNNGGAPRMPQLRATIAALNGTTVWWKLSVINHGLHGPSGAPYRDFDSGAASLTSAQITQLTDVNETGLIGYSDDIDVPLPTQSADSGVINGWIPVSADTPWDIAEDPDWKAAVARGFFGGDAEISVKITSSDGNTIILPEYHFYFRIAGENPPANTTNGAGACQDYINSRYGGPTPNWTGLKFTSGTTPPAVPGYWFAYAISKEETDGNGGRTWYNQFLDNGGMYNTRVPGKEGYPNWQNDTTSNGSGGYGLFQLTYGANETNFIMPRDWIWNWKSNVQQFLPIITQKLQDAQYSVNRTKTKHSSAFTDPSLLTTVADTTTFTFWESTVITRYNSGRGWNFSPSSGWSYTPNSENYLYKVARKGIENHP